MPTADRIIVRSLFLLRQMIRASEKTGTHGVRPHAALGKGAFLDKLTAQNNVTASQGFRNKIDIPLDSHTTLWELRQLLGQELVKKSTDEGKTWSIPEGTKPVHPATFRLYSLTFTKDLGDGDNGQTLQDLKVKPNDTLTVFKKSQLSQKKAYNVVDDEEAGRPVLTFKAKQVAKEIFGRFSAANEDKVEVISGDSLLSFTQVACDDSTLVHDSPALQSFVDSYGLDGKPEVPLEGIEKFFIEACTTGQDLTLRKNLERFGYGHDLTLEPQRGDDDNIKQVRHFLHANLG